MMSFEIRRENCIVCNNRLSGDIVFIGEQYPSAVFPEAGSDYRSELPKSSLNVAKCTHENCGLVQLSNDYDLDVVFENYPFVSGTTATMDEILADVLREGLEAVQLSSSDIVLDIGGNDGTMLSLIDQPVGKLLNIDAAHGVTSVVASNNYQRIQAKFTAKTYLDTGLKGPKLIFSVAMFYHLNDPVHFCKDVAKIMTTDSVWVIQMTYLGSMLESNIYDNIVHEHVAYYSLKSLEHLMGEVGLEVFHASVVNSYGGSIRACVRKKGSNAGSSLVELGIEELKRYETQSEVNTFEALVRFNDRVKLLKNLTRELILHINDREGLMVALGASTKGNMMCQLLGLNNKHISTVLDNNAKKIGLTMSGTDIPISDENEVLDDPPKYLFVLPYYYLSFFKKMIARKLKKSQVCYLVVPLPEPHIVKLIGEN